MRIGHLEAKIFEVNFLASDDLAHVWCTRKSRGVPGRTVRSEKNTMASEHINQSNHLKE
jgi:hypothetical protein